MAIAKPRVKLNTNPTAGEAVVVKTLIRHPMESGQRKDKEGNPIPRKIVNKFSALFNGETVVAVDLEPAVSANPYFEFTAKFPESGTLVFQWHDDDGSVYELEEQITVS